MQGFERKRVATGVILKIRLRPRVGVTRTAIWFHSAATPVAGFSALCRLRDRSCVVGSAGHAPVTAVMRQVRRDVEAALSPDNSPEISEDSTFSNLREVIMTMSEYEERFRPQRHHCIKPSRRSEDSIGEEGRIDDFGLRLP